jgi:hypothetical protein
LEPGARTSRRKFAGKSSGYRSSSLFCATGARGPFSLRRGLDSVQCFSSWASPFSLCPTTTKATR